MNVGDLLENTYIQYFFNASKDFGEQQEQSRLRDQLHFQLRWTALYSLLEITKGRMKDDNNTQGYDQISAIQKTLINVGERAIVREISAYVFNKITAS